MLALLAEVKSLLSLSCLALCGIEVVADAVPSEGFATSQNIKVVRVDRGIPLRFPPRTVGQSRRFVADHAAGEGGGHFRQNEIGGIERIPQPRVRRGADGGRRGSWRQP